ncbi:translation repressor RelE/RelB/StbE [Acetobacter sp. DmW_043]|uniref:type II toxin-antitoxin system RelE/ParE family toxin n=1 Tax=Acetobacter sp. DmW_043 TaxID=1670658 RepID=UPI000A375105|nr:type II toxin-antitoxin system RelE/ParE family toxin [Acetobacter sp. DmW_043]OUI86179.1 translation repressor RelE/RelB/StbE [Acetobacter sp. DmW_043]
MHSVIETPIFTKRADALLSREERAELIRLLAENPRQGDIIPGTGGVRKLRFAGSGRGKRGGVRVIWYVASDRFPVYALLIYGKNEQDDLTPDQKKAMTSMAERIKRSDQGGT